MRAPVDEERVRALADALGRVAPAGTKLYLTGGATAVLEGWRASTVDVDVLFEPESEQVTRALVDLKEALNINIEFASPADFLPELPGWRDRSRFRFRSGTIEVFDYDLHSQALAKVERGFETDLVDVGEMLTRGLVDPAKLRALLEQIEDELHRFPAVSRADLRAKLDRALSANPPT